MPTDDEIITAMDDPELQAIAEGRSKGDKICVGPDGKPIEILHPSSSKKIRDRRAEKAPSARPLREWPTDSEGFPYYD